MKKKDDIADIVRKGYDKASHLHQFETDQTRTNLAIYQEFKTQLLEGPVVELGFGDGSPIGIDLLNSGYNYQGIDISESQVELARSKFPQYTDNFNQGEMLDYCHNQKSNSLGGLVSMFAIFHIPRYVHVELFIEILRILKPGAPLLFTCHPSTWEGTEENWLGAPKMYWSNFSNKWYDLTLQELGFVFMMQFRKVTAFNEKEEIQYFMLYKSKNKEHDLHKQTPI
ncbi:MAG: class I SAM-dependent methyltransferase [Candidatus Kariarchaeaceae archaeon]|jgi:SAM-dependent methyltransferase